jgi:putative chitinase
MRQIAIVVMALLVCVLPASADDARVDPVTYNDLREMFPGKVGDVEIVRRGLPRLNKQMAAAHITSPERVAAFLTTLAYESTFLYNVSQYSSDKRYRGRGYIQLTGSYNYRTAGKYFSIDLHKRPELARSLKWSAPIARWYWTVARDINPLADKLDMGRVNAAIGYPPGPHDQVRCKAFKSALKYLTGKKPKGVKCARPEPVVPDQTLFGTVPMDQARDRQSSQTK